jgi:hypothetical protein
MLNKIDKYMCVYVQLCTLAVPVGSRKQFKKQNGESRKQFLTIFIIFML